MLLLDIEPLVERLPNSRTLAPASAFPPALAEIPDAPPVPRVDPRHVALAALTMAEQRKTARGSDELQKQARTLLSALDLLGGTWLASPPVPDVRSVVDSVRFRDQVVQVLRPLLAKDPSAASWIELVLQTSPPGDTRFVSYDLRIVAKLTGLASSLAPDQLSEQDARRLSVAACNAALACERSVTWAEGSHERTVRENVQRVWPELLSEMEKHLRLVRGEADARACERTLAGWSRTKGPEAPEVVLPAARKPIEVSIDATSPSTFWEGFTDGGPVGGVFVATYGQRREAERVVLELDIEGSGAHRALGIVRWTRSAASNVEPGLGVELVDASAALEAKIRAFTRRRPPLRIF